jgi:DNA-binding NtrC family response regulator
MADGSATRAGHGSGASILVVDDQDDVARLMAMVLTSHGHPADAARSVAEARERYAAASAPSVVITDVWLADGNGVDLIAELGHPLTAVLFTSGHPRDAFDGTPAAIPPMAAFVQKPCPPAALLAAVQAIEEALA